MRATVRQLESVIVFSDLETAVLSELSSVSAVKSYKKNEIVIHEGDSFLVAFHAILEGDLLVQKISTSGKETNLRKLMTGEMFAAPALFGNGIAPGTVIALKDSKIVTIDKKDLLKAIQIEPEIALKILRYFNQRLQEMHQTIHDLVSEKAVVRLTRLIHYTAYRYGTRETSEGTRMNTKLPHQQMARMVGITYEECVRIVGKNLDGIVNYDRGGIITIVDASALESIAFGDQDAFE